MTLKNVAMFLAAPVFGLVYVLLFPFIGLVMLLWMAGRAAAARTQRLSADGQLTPRPDRARSEGRGRFPRPFFHRSRGFPVYFSEHAATV